ncbi:Ribosome biogenesis regulatory protein-like [Cricetulus griseus]|uniref:Ribosome biogenesis regulatory protein-like n=1 Tax=Cricetulus griseus TaxID=10029 RepID=G3HKB8_CRIGR|nr:Ribosome biogenesis regulatory protein-like [Cricetulus griseus]
MSAGATSAWDDTKEWLIQVPGGSHPMEDQFAKQIQAKKDHVAKNELNRLQNLARASAQGPDAQLSRPAPSGTPEEGGAGPRHVAKGSTASVGCFQESLPQEKATRGHRQEEDILAPLGDFPTGSFSRLQLLRVMNSKKPQLDVMRAANKQMREEDQEEIANRRKMGLKGKKKGTRQGPLSKRKSQGEGEKRKGSFGGQKHSRPPALGGKKKGMPHQGGQRRK